MSASITLPTEIWLMVLENVCRCPHCLGIYEFNLPTYEQGKTDLVALSLTSRAMRNLAQPVLYHCFYGYPYKNTLSKFLRTLMSQPQLARHVRALVLPEDLAGTYVLENETEYLTFFNVVDWVGASLRCGIPPPRWLHEAVVGAESDVAAFDERHWNCRLRFKDPQRQSSDDTLSHDELMRWLRLWQQVLTMELCSSSLTYLAVTEIDIAVLNNNPRVVDPAKKPFRFPNLRQVSCGLVWSFEEFHWFFRHAPRLSSISFGVAGGPQGTVRGWTPPSSLTNVKSLSLACTAPYQGRILQECSQVEDLELHFLGDTNTAQPPLNPWPASAKKLLRRLCWSSTVAYNTRGFLPTEDEVLNMFPPLADFRNLEILEIDRLSLDICLMRDQGPDMFEEEMIRPLSTILPRSLRTLRLLYLESLSWSWLILDLEELASAKATSLPVLSYVQIDWEPRLMTSFPQNEKSLPEAMFDLGVTRAMKDVGVELKFGFGSFSYRGLIPPMPANLDAFSTGWGMVIP